MGAGENETGSGVDEAGGNNGGTGGPENALVGEIIVANGSPGPDSGTTGKNQSVDPSTGSEVRRGRGRPLGSASKRKAAETVPHGIADSLRGFAELVAFALRCPELKVSEAEAKQFEQRYAEVQKHYPSKINPGHLAIFNLIAICGLIFIPKGAAAYRRIKAERKTAKEKTGDDTKPKT